MKNTSRRTADERVNAGRVNDERGRKGKLTSCAVVPIDEM